MLEIIVGTKGIDGIEGKDASVSRAGRCYHWLLEDGRGRGRSYYGALVE